jgi:hypothetical protein
MGRVSTQRRVERGFSCVGQRSVASGAAGPWVGLQPLLRSMGVAVSVCLTDQCPNVAAFERAPYLSKQAITHHREPVDAAQVDSGFTGFRTMFTALHHFRPEQARTVLALWDSVVSVLRVYSVEELRGPIVGLNGYHWDIGQVRSRRLPIAVTYLIGVPERLLAEQSVP